MKYDIILEKIEGISIKLDKLQQVQNDKVFLDTEELCITMNISKRTARVWRSNNIIGFIKVRGKYYYRTSDVLTLLDENYVPAKPLSE